MFLSNPAKSFLAAALISTACGGCGFFRSYIERMPTAASEPKSGIPFSVKEPDVFQAEFVTTSGNVSTVSFYARKAENWRFDPAFGSENSISLVKSDKMYSVSRANKTYAEVPAGDIGATQPDFIADMTYSLLKEPNNTRFEEAGKEGTISKYRVLFGENQASQAIVYFDESVGMVVREEFLSLRSAPNAASQPEFVFELRNLKMDVADSIFAIPAGFQKVDWSDYSTFAKQKK